MIDGEAAYVAYCNYAGWVAFNGDPLPKWADLPAKIRGDWIAAAEEIVGRT